jgi:hypothetical protein
LGKKIGKLAYWWIVCGLGLSSPQIHFELQEWGVAPSALYLPMQIAFYSIPELRLYLFLQVPICNIGPVSHSGKLVAAGKPVLRVHEIQ